MRKRSGIASGLRTLARLPTFPEHLTMIAPLSKDQKDLILYCLEQQYYEFNEAEQADYEFIVTKLGLNSKKEAP